MSSATNLMFGASLSASSYDSTSPECFGGRCKVNAVANDGSGHEDNDKTYWQSEVDPTCSNPWIQAVFAEPAVIQNFTIEYDNLPPSTKPVQVFLNAESSSVIDASSSVSCQTSFLQNTGNTSRIDTCVMNPQHGADSVKLSWTLDPVRGNCQMNVDEIIVWGVPGGETQSSPTHLSVGAIVGIVLGCIVVIVLMIVAVIRINNLKRRLRTGRL